MEQIPIGDGERPDNVVPLLGGRTEPEVESTEPEAEPDPEPIGEAAAQPALGPLLEQSARILAGFVSAAAAALSDAMRETTPHSEPTEDDELTNDEPSPAAPPAFALTAGAAAGLAVEMSQAAAHAATAFAETAGPFLSWFTNSPMVRRGMTDIEERAQDLNERWARERPVSEDAASEFSARLIPELTNTILDRIDLTQIAIDRVDVDRIVEHIDINAIIERVDVNAIIDQIDLAALADQVLAEIDLPEIIRGSTNAVTSETVRTVRVQSAKGDRAIAGLVDRILRRTAERDVDAHGEHP